MTVVGARPQFIKAAIVSRRLREIPSPPYEDLLVHTGQHYDRALSEVFFEELSLPQPVANLGVGSDSPARQLARMLERLETVVAAHSPNAMLVYGDTNSTLAAALAAATAEIPLIHVEAGERIYRRRKNPEEINRVLTDNAASLCLTSTRRACANLLREGFQRERVRFVGDPMYDLFLWASQRQTESRSMELPPQFHLATIHRAENTDSAARIVRFLRCLDASDVPVLLPLHPRVQARLDGCDFRPTGSLRLISPVGYFEFLSLLQACDKVVTDSGGVSREAFFAGKPCIILVRDSWWKEIVDSGWAIDVGDDLDALAFHLRYFRPTGNRPTGLFGDGDSAKRIIESVGELLRSQHTPSLWAAA